MDTLLIISVSDIYNKASVKLEGLIDIGMCL